MKQFNTSLLAISLTVLLSCSSGPTLDRQLVGTWNMEKVYEGESNVTTEHNPNSNRWIKFNRNGSFESGGDPYGYNDGVYDLEMEKGILFIDSKIEGDDSEWNITIDENTMTWTGIGTPRQESFKIVMIKEVEE